MVAKVLIIQTFGDLYIVHSQANGNPSKHCRGRNAAGPGVRRYPRTVYAVLQLPLCLWQMLMEPPSGVGRSSGLWTKSGTIIYHSRNCDMPSVANNNSPGDANSFPVVCMFCPNLNFLPLIITV